MKIFKKEIVGVFFLIVMVVLFYYTIKNGEYYYYSQSTKNIKFIQIDTSSLRVFTDIFKDPFFKDKTTYIVLDFYVWNEDLEKNFPYFKKLADKYQNKPFQILYTNDGFHGVFDRQPDYRKELSYKKGIRLFKLYGYHTTLPSIFRFREDHWLESARYLLVKDGIIKDTFPPSPYKYEELCEKINSLLEE